MRTFITIGIFILFLLSSETLVLCLPNVAEDIPNVEKKTDRESAGWAYKINDTAYTITFPECRIQWNVEELKETPEEYHLSMRTDCNGSFHKLEPAHRKILTAIFGDFEPERFKGLGWGMFGNDRASDWSWCIPIAVASSTHDDWIDSRTNYPNCKKQPRCRSTNSIFVELANKTDAYKELRLLFKEFGLTLQLKEVEKVFAQRVNELPFQKDLTENGIKGNPRLIYDAGMTWFTLRK